MDLAEATLVGGVIRGALTAPPAARIVAADDRNWRKKSMAGSHWRVTEV